MHKENQCIQYRIMEEKDLDQVCEIEQETFSQPWKREDFLQMIQQDHSLYIVAVQNETEIVIGGCGVRNILGEGEITNVVIRKEYRNQGLAYLMLQELILQGEEIGITDYTLEVRESNLVAINLYKKLDFHIEGIRKNFYEKPIENGIIMWKRKK
jgi:[ribosomal protein S18]-alanine N-acetyltransferase